MCLFLQSETGELVPTQNQLQLDAHFELPRGTCALFYYTALILNTVLFVDYTVRNNIHNQSTFI